MRTTNDQAIAWQDSIPISHSPITQLLFLNDTVQHCARYRDVICGTTKGHHDNKLRVQPKISKAVIPFALSAL